MNKLPYKFKTPHFSDIIKKTLEYKKSIMHVDEKDKLLKSDQCVYHIVGCDIEGGIAKDGEIPWDASDDLFLFERFTRGNIVIMGRKTFQTIGKPLPNRKNIVLTTKEYFNSSKKNLTFAPSLERAYDIAASDLATSDVFIAGGERVYFDSFDKKFLDGVFLSVINRPDGYNCDKFYDPMVENVITDDELDKHFSVESHSGKSFDVFFYNFDNHGYEIDEDFPI